MKHTRIFLFILLLAAMPLASFAQEDGSSEEGQVLGQNAAATDVIQFAPDVVVNNPVSRDIIAGAGTVTVNKPVAKDALLLGGNIIINAPIAQNLRAFGGTVIISDEIGGNVLVGAGTVRINSPVKGDIRIAGGDVVISSTIGGNVAVAGGRIIFTKDSAVKGSVAMRGGEIELNGEIDGNVNIKAEKAVIANQVAGDAEISVSEGANLMLLDGANIAGSLTYKASSPNGILDESMVKGNIVFQESARLSPQRGNSFIWFFRLIGLFGMLVVGLVMVSIAPKSIRSAISSSIKNPSRDLLWGLGVLIIAPVAALLLLLTIIGFPLAVMLGIAYAVSLYFAKVLVGIVLGTYVWGAFKGKKRAHEASLLATMVAGVVILWLISGIPFVGWLLQLMAVIWGLGILVKININAFKKLED